MKKYYHIFSNGDDAKDFILGKADYIAALNRLGVCAAQCDCRVIAFDIEDTHFHLLLYGTEEECIRFYKLFRKLSMMHISRRADRNDAELRITMYEISDIDYLLNVMLYVTTQPTKDGRSVMYYDYVWGSGPLYFRGEKVILPWYIDSNGLVNKPIRAGSMTVNQKRRILKTKNLTVPDDWLVCNGILLPENYVDVKAYEGIVRTHNRYRCFAANGRDKDKAVMDAMSRHRGVELDEAEARRATVSISKELFGLNDIRILNTDQRLVLAGELRKRYHIGLSQISRRVHLPEAEVRKYIK